jgi:O6-methylguanine-DNA--protein-cysteine methyltransferase
MANTFAELRKSRTKDLEKLTEQVNKLNDKSSEKKSYEDTRFWKPTVDKAGNGMAVIRFLPAAEGEDMPWVQLFSHSFQGPTGQWYIENSLTTLNKKDPVSEYNTMLWNSGVESDKETARKQKRKLQYIANVYIVKDPSNPDNDGKVFLFKFGKKIFDKLNDLMNPEFEDETPVNPFDLWEGANFKLKIRKVEGYQNYDKSEFDSPTALSEDDDELERIWKAQNKLSEFITEGNFKSYDELKARLNKVLNLEDDVTNEKPSAPVTKKAEKPAEVKKAKTVEDSPPWNDEDGDLSYFEKLAED